MGNTRREHKAILFRLYPTEEQANQMAQYAGACRFVYNLALEQRRDWYRPGRKFNFASQCREVTQLRAEIDWLTAVNCHHDRRTDSASCYCTVWNSGEHPSVGMAVESWIQHVIKEYRARTSLSDGVK